MKWFRLYNEVMDDPKMLDVDDQHFRLFVYLMCLASECEKDGSVPFTPERIAWRLRCPLESVESTIARLKELHIIDENGAGLRFLNWNKRQFLSDNVTERSRRHRVREKGTLHETFQGTLHETLHETLHATFDATDRTEQSRTEQNRTEQNRNISSPTATEEDKPGTPSACVSHETTPHEAIVKLYHETLPELKPVKIWSPERKKQLQARWNEEPKRQALEWWHKYFSYIRDSEFLMGKNDKHWTPNLEWFVKKANLINVIEGKYHGQ